MKKSYLLFLTIVAAISLISFAGGYGAPATGAPGDNNSCGQSGCHAAGNFDPTLSISLMDTDGNSVSEYIAGNEYVVSMEIAAASTAVPSGYGFQMVCLDEANDPINSYGDLPSGMRSFMNADRQYLVQSQRLPSSRIDIPWTAPAAGAVTFYGGGIAANGNGNPQQDGGAEGTATFSRNTVTTSSLRDDLFTVHPNPTTDYITVQSDEVVEIELMSATGQTLLRQTKKTIDLSAYAAGNFVVRAKDVNGKSQSVVVVRK